ncbi:transcriptional regulator, TetR family (plasmid) [Rhodococcus jostii RHA1]|uniref:Transcriptional regulator, TetR family n=1 Tax=Rhodococcus jostii (strain RHA1) TaxID=101510 RepID=Q0RVK6_RHOJR|nr:TetR/AcrR family transcriptional regulator [Rhodococcus jostii]ABH00680.1 transcriptional regulator, TetR family [Rhodococcus jostii RHA1]
MVELVVDEPVSLRVRIQRVFTECVAQQGFRGTALSEVSDRLGISKGTILHHFKSKEALLARIGEDYIDRRERELQHILSHLDGPQDRLIAVIVSITLCHRDDLAATRAFGREFARYADSPQLDQVRLRRHAYTERVEEVIAEAMAADVVREDDPRLVALQIFGMCNWTWSWYRPEGSWSIEEIADRYVRTLLLGLGCDPARVEQPSVPSHVHDEVVRAAVLARETQSIRDH